MCITIPIPEHHPFTFSDIVRHTFKNSKPNSYSNYVTFDVAAGQQFHNSFNKGAHHAHSVT